MAQTVQDITNANMLVYLFTKKLIFTKLIGMNISICLKSTQQEISPNLTNSVKKWFNASCTKKDWGQYNLFIKKNKKIIK